MRRLLTASLKGHARRFVAGGIAIVLSVAYICAVLIAIDSAEQARLQALGAQYSSADLVATRGDDQVNADMLRRVKTVDGVVAVAPSITVNVATSSSPGGRTQYVQAGSVPADPELRWQQPTSGRLPAKPGEVAVTSGFAEDGGITLGGTVTVQGRDQPGEQLTVVGTVSGGWIAAPDLYLDQSTAWALSNDMAYGDLLVRLAEGADQEQVAAAVAEAAGAGESGAAATVLTPEAKVSANMQDMTSGVDVYGRLLLGFAAIAMFVALLVVTNTFTIVIAQRARELALFRCVGAAKRQVFAAVLAESAVLGAVFSILGAVGGIGLAQATLQLLKRFTDLAIPLDVVTIRPAALLIPVTIGLLTTVVAALAPARRATRVPPLAALHPEAALQIRSRAGVFRLALGVLCLLVGGVALALSMQGLEGSSGILVGIGGGAVSFLGVLLFAPVLVPLVVRLLGVAARSGGVPGKVAVGNSVRNPRRTAATASALLIGVTLISLLSVGAESSQATIARTLNTQFPVDITASVAGTRMPQEGEPPARLPAKAAEAVAGVPDVAATAEVYGAKGRLGEEKTTRLIAAVDPETARTALRHSRPVEGLQDGVVALGPMSANGLGVSDGDQLAVSVGERSRTMQVKVIDEPLTPAVLVTTADLRRLASEPRLVGVWAKIVDGADPQTAVDGLEEALAGAPDAELSGSFATRALYAQIADALLMVASGLLGVAVAIALVGVGNTLSLSILERTRENALLRALGLTRAQLRGTLGLEAVLIAGTAVLLGLGLGVVYGYAGTAALLAAVPDVDGIQLAIPWDRLGLVALVAVGAGLLASVLPARRAAKVPPAAALGDE